MGWWNLHGLHVKGVSALPVKNKWEKEIHQTLLIMKCWQGKHVLKFISVIVINRNMLSSINLIPSSVCH